MYLCTCEKVGRKRRPWGQFSTRFPPHSILQGNFEVQYRTTSAPPLSPHPSPPQPDSSNSLLQTSPDASYKCRKVLRSKREVVFQWWYGLAEKDFFKL